MTSWVADNLGVNVHLHFSAFQPDWKMRNIQRTPKETLLWARSIALAAGIHYAYIGNVHYVEADSTWCPACGKILIEHDWYRLRLGIWMARVAASIAAPS